MEIEFDPNKDTINRRKHGLSLADAALMDFDTASYEHDIRRAYGEDRFQAHGLIDGRLHVLAFLCAATCFGRFRYGRPTPER